MTLEWKRKWLRYIKRSIAWLLCSIVDFSWVATVNMLAQVVISVVRLCGRRSVCVCVCEAEGREKGERWSDDRAFALKALLDKSKRRRRESHTRMICLLLSSRSVFIESERDGGRETEREWERWYSSRTKWRKRERENEREEVVRGDPGWCPCILL